MVEQVSNHHTWCPLETSEAATTAAVTGGIDIRTLQVDPRRARQRSHRQPHEYHTGQTLVDVAVLLNHMSIIEKLIGAGCECKTLTSERLRQPFPDFGPPPLEALRKAYRLSRYKLRITILIMAGWHQRKMEGGRFSVCVWSTGS